MARNTGRADDSPATEDRPLQDRALDAVKAAPETVRQTANVLAEKAPDAVNASQEAIRASQGALNEASRRIQASSPQDLTTWAGFGMGLLIGLLLGRAPRLLVLAAGLPALILGGALIARRDTPEIGSDI